MGDRAFVALGTNMGDRAANLAAARNRISLLPGCRLLAASRIEETAPLGRVAQGPYLNQMVAVHTALPPLVLLAQLQGIERALGRVRRVRWGARTIDLDIVRHGDVVLSHPSLTLPHPGLGQRPFWDRELAELGARLAAA